MSGYVPRYASPELWDQFEKLECYWMRPGTACSDHNAMSDQKYHYEAFVEGRGLSDVANKVLRLRAFVKCAEHYLHESISSHCGCEKWAEGVLRHNEDKLKGYLESIGAHAE